MGRVKGGPIKEGRKECIYIVAVEGESPPKARGKSRDEKGTVIKV